MQAVSGWWLKKIRVGEGIDETPVARNIRFFNISDRFIRLRDGCICGDFSDFATE